MKPHDLPIEVSPHSTPEQLRYARLLQVCTWAGLCWIAAGFLAYTADALPAHVPLRDLPGLWGLPLPRFLEATSMPTGWHLLAAWPKADAAMLLGVALLASAPGLCLAALMPMYLRSHDRAYLAITACVLMVLAVAASGLLHAPH